MTLAQTSAFQYISPKPNSMLNSRETNIILKQGSFIDKLSVQEYFFVVSGSESGIQKGTLILSDDDKTLVFQPFKKFIPNEVVTVNLLSGIKTTAGKEIGPLSFSFTISPAREIVNQSQKIAPILDSYTDTSNNSLTIQADSLPTDFPKITVGTSHNPYDGKIFIANKPAVSKPPYGNYILIADNNGSIIKYKKFAQAESNFKVLPNGELSFSENGRHIVTDTSLTPIDTFKCGNGYTADSHDFLLLPNGHSLLLAYDSQPVDMSLIVSGGKPDATVIGTIIQELDASKNVVFQWRTWDYLPITSSYINLTTQTVDYSHGNALEVDKDGNIFIVLRHTSNVVKINRLTGNVDWILGGKQNEFTFINEHEFNAPNYFSYPHHMSILPNGNITLFDNGDQHTPMYSRGVEYRLDEKNKTVTLVWEYRHVPDIYTASGGSVQRLPNGNTIVGWSRGGAASGSPAFTELQPDNSVALEIFFPVGQFSYRSYKFPWISQMPGASVTVSEVLQGNTYTFNKAADTTGITITFQQLAADMYSNAIVTKYNYAPIDPDFIEQAPLMDPSFFKIQGELITSYKGLVQVDVSKYRGISNPKKTVVYVRPLYSKIFIPLPTGYDSVKNELLFTTSDFGDFAFGMPQSVTAYAPNPISPKQNEIVNGESAVNLHWGIRGVVQTYHLQVATDSAFQNLVVDTKNLTMTSFALKNLNNNSKYFWRVNTTNAADTSDWSNIFVFRTGSPFITILNPNGSERIYFDSTYIIRWQTNVRDTVRVVLTKGSVQALIIVDSAVSRTNAIAWKVPSSLQSDSSYNITITSVNHEGINDRSDNSFTIGSGISGVFDRENSIVRYSLFQNYPNPFNPTTVINYQLPTGSYTTLKIYDVLGREIATLVNEIKNSGTYTVEFEAHSLSAGVYFYRLQAGKFSSIKKMTLIK